MKDEIIIGNMPYIKFPEGNKIRYWMDFALWETIPSDVMFYPIREGNTGITFIGEGHGILKNNKYGLKGSYGNGSIDVLLEYLPENIIEYCRNNFLKETDK